MGPRRRRGTCGTLRHRRRRRDVRACCTRYDCRTIAAREAQHDAALYPAHERSRQLTRARLGHHAPDLVVWLTVVFGIDRSYRLYRDVVVDRLGSRLVRAVSDTPGAPPP